MAYDDYLEAERRRMQALEKFRLTGSHLDSPMYHSSAQSALRDAQAIASATAAIQSSATDTAALYYQSPISEELSLLRGLRGTLANQSVIQREVDSIVRQIASASALEEQNLQTAVSLFGLRGSDIASLQGLPQTVIAEQLMHQRAQSRLIADIVQDRSQAALYARDYGSMLRQIAQPEAASGVGFESYRHSAEAWVAGQGWQPSARSFLDGIEGGQSAALNAVMDGWRDKPGYADAFKAIAASSDAMAATRGDYSAFASLFGDIKALSYSPDFETSPQVRLRAYLDAGLDPLLLKPNQHALASMLTMNDFIDPSLWERSGSLIVPPKRRMRKRLQHLKPTRLQRLAFAETGALERWLREFIDDEMSYAYGDEWYKERAPKSLMGRIRKREIGEDGISGVIVLDDADFAHYLEIILHPDHWDEVFCYIFNDRDETDGMLRLFKNLRKAIAHFDRGYSKADLSQLRLCTRWFEEKADGPLN